MVRYHQYRGSYYNIPSGQSMNIFPESCHYIPESDHCTSEISHYTLESGQYTSKSCHCTSKSGHCKSGRSLHVRKTCKHVGVRSPARIFMLHHVGTRSLHTTSLLSAIIPPCICNIIIDWHEYTHILVYVCCRHWRSCLLTHDNPVT